MRKPKPIRLNPHGSIQLCDTAIRIRTALHQCWLSDRDIKRLAKWCEYILQSREKGKKK